MDFNSATTYIRSHRNIPPALYNRSRLNEAPIPIRIEEIILPEPNIDIETGEETHIEDPIETNPLENLFSNFDTAEFHKSQQNDRNIQVSVDKTNFMGSVQIARDTTNTFNRFSMDLVEYSNVAAKSSTENISCVDDHSAFETSDSQIVQARENHTTIIAKVSTIASTAAGVDLSASATASVLTNTLTNTSPISISSSEFAHTESAPVVGSEGSVTNMAVMKAENTGEPFPIYEISNQNMEGISNLIEEFETIIGDDDCTMTYTQFPMPLKATSDGLVKREGDHISGNIPFFVTVSSDPESVWN